MSARAFGRRGLVALLLLAGALPQGALAADIRVLSAGAIEPGLRPALAAFERASGHRVQLQFATAPVIRSRLTAGPQAIDAFEIVIAPPAVLDAMPADPSRREPGDAVRCSERIAIGRVGLGVAVGPGARRPDIASAAAFRQTLRDADALVYNRASTGLYLEGLLKRLGVDAELAPKTTRYPDGAAVMQHVVHAQGRALGLGAITEILLATGDGVQFVGPLPAELQNFTDYMAAPTCSAAPAETRQATEALLRELAGPAAQALLRRAGIDASP